MNALAVIIAIFSHMIFFSWGILRRLFLRIEIPVFMFYQFMGLNGHGHHADGSLSHAIWFFHSN
ncbi:hypothetical protein HMPREF1599_04965 [Escherichia coli 907713]|nr:hypothetical protein HMPREF1599_04965 [Escherichia coli 907713]